MSDVKRGGARKEGLQLWVEARRLWLQTRLRNWLIMKQARAKIDKWKLAFSKLVRQVIRCSLKILFCEGWKQQMRCQGSGQGTSRSQLTSPFRSLWNVVGPRVGAGCLAHGWETQGPGTQSGLPSLWFAPWAKSRFHSLKVVEKTYATTPLW